ncbi:uncharacterized protein LOC144877222 [Branchiostoma floridae x Branchiostoma japonicum]
MGTGCSSPLGMESGYIQDDQISESSSSSRFGAENARLNGSSEWRANVFEGNRDTDSIRENTFNPPIIARFIKVNPRGWNTCGKLRCISMRIELIGCDFTTTTEPSTVSTTITTKTTSSQPTSTVRTTRSTLASTSTNGLSASTIQAPPKSSQASVTTTVVLNRTQGDDGNRSMLQDSGFPTGAIIGGAVASGVVIFIILIIVFIFVRRRRSRNTEGKQSAQQPEEMGRNNIRGPYVSEDVEYVDTLPSNVNSQQNSGTDNVGYENIPMDAPVRTLQQSGTLGGDVYVNVPPASPSGQYEELRPAVYQSLQKVYENTPPGGGAYGNVPPPPPSGQYEELRPAVYQSLQKC